MWVMRDSNVANAAKESAQAEFPHGLQGLTHRAIQAKNRGAFDWLMGQTDGKQTLGYLNAHPCLNLSHQTFQFAQAARIVPRFRLPDADGDRAARRRGALAVVANQKNCGN